LSIASGREEERPWSSVTKNVFDVLTKGDVTRKCLPYQQTRRERCFITRLRRRPVEPDAARVARPARRRLVQVKLCGVNLHVLSDSKCSELGRRRKTHLAKSRDGPSSVKAGARERSIRTAFSNPVEGVRTTACLAAGNSGESPVRFAQLRWRGEPATWRHVQPGL
jgi:hypothetical protein